MTKTKTCVVEAYNYLSFYMFPLYQTKLSIITSCYSYFQIFWQSIFDLWWLTQKNYQEWKILVLGKCKQILLHIYHTNFQLQLHNNERHSLECMVLAAPLNHNMLTWSLVLNIWSMSTSYEVHSVMVSFWFSMGISNCMENLWIISNSNENNKLVLISQQSEV